MSRDFARLFGSGDVPATPDEPQPEVEFLGPDIQAWSGRSTAPGVTPAVT